jgi:tRNA (guanine-N7-)-methyltransferase
MRLRNIAKSAKIVENHRLVVNNPKEYKDKWSELFENKGSIHLEIGMGKGQFITQKALENPHINYIGVERYTSVLLRALEKVDSTIKKMDERVVELIGFGNLRFICMDAREIPDVFAKEEISKIYLNFSDPWPKSRHASRRLTSVEFLKRYEEILANGGKLEFKTDNVDLFNFSLWQVKEARWQLESATKNLHQEESLNQGNIMTEYEEKFSGEGVKICKLICHPYT